jgi:hypothetical protein
MSKASVYPRCDGLRPDFTTKDKNEHLPSWSFLPIAVIGLEPTQRCGRFRIFIHAGVAL